MSRVNEILYEGKKILFVDYNGIGPAQIDDILAEARTHISSAPHQSVLLLSDFNDVSYDKDSTQKMKEFSQANTPYVKASAVVGISGLKKIIYNAVVKATGRNIQLFNTLEEAKQWLLTQAD